MLGKEDLAIIDMTRDLYADDIDLFDRMKEDAGKGEAEDYEYLNVGMAQYHVMQAQDYLDQVLEAAEQRDTAGVNPFAGDEWPDPEDYDLPEKINEVTIIDTDGSEIYLQNGKQVAVTVPTGKIGPTIHTPATTVIVPLHKDEDKMREIALELINQSPEDVTLRPGFQGWMAGEITGKLGGKADPNKILRVIREVLADESE